MRKLWVTFGCIMAMMLGSEALAKMVFVDAEVVYTLVDAQAFGGCMARLSVSPPSVGLSCKANWVSASCTGDFQDKDSAHRMFEVMQVAALTNTVIKVRLDDSKLHNGYCTVNRVYLLP